MDEILMWILLHSVDAPPNIREKALEIYTDHRALFGPKNATAPIRLDPLSLSKVLACLQNGKKIQAIKEVRTVTGCGLKEAKDAVEYHIAHNPQDWNPQRP